jgi:Ras-related protein Rab-1A
MEDNDIKRKVLKISVLGDTGVGKTSIINAFLNKDFKDDTISNIGSEKISKKMTMNDGNEMKILIWDTAGQERFRSIATSTIKNSQGIVLVFDLTQKESFKNLGKWLEDINNNGGETKILFGNKFDLLEKVEVSEKEAKEFAFENKMNYFSTSAKENINIEEGFKEICQKAYENNKETIGMSLGDSGKKKKNNPKKCC